MPAIFCNKCRQSFEPDLHTRGKWISPHCKAKNANLRRHYRSIADLFILGLFFIGIAFSFGRPRPIGLALILVAADCTLLLVTIFAIFRSKTPWASVPIRSLIWIVFLLAFSVNVGVPLIGGRLPIAALVVYALLFPYLFWLQWRSQRANTVGPGEVIENTFSAEQGRR
jgi:hypothetical protein